MQMELQFMHDKYRTLNYGHGVDNLKQHESYDKNLERVKQMLNKYDSAKYNLFCLKNKFLINSLKLTT